MALTAGRRRRLVACAPVVVGMIILAGCQGGESGKGADTTARAGGGAAGGQGGGMDNARADSAMRLALADSGSWASYGRDYTNQRYSPLAQLTAANVTGLRLAWSYHTGLPQAFEASPVIIDGTMYVSTPLSTPCWFNRMNPRTKPSASMFLLTR